MVASARERPAGTVAAAPFCATALVALESTERPADVKVPATDRATEDAEASGAVGDAVDSESAGADVDVERAERTERADALALCRPLPALADLDADAYAEAWEDVVCVVVGR